MKNKYLRPILVSVLLDLDHLILYSGLKDMTDNPVCPEDDLDGDN